MFRWLKGLLDGSADPARSCAQYLDKEDGSCAHVDGPLCDFPKCSMLQEYKQRKEGMTVAGNGVSELGKLMREQRACRKTPGPHA